ncbi:hypothetical protein F66182_8454 [Fusarium sp. NRRL 66182]|nr:hypothetical protein F66182_8454 [Fusarium sp. NRRL 66182]
MPAYQLSIPEVWADWTWSEKFPCREELCRYFDHVDKVLDIKRDVFFNAKVTSAQYSPSSNLWRVGTEKGGLMTSRFLLLATGFSAKPYMPDIQGSETFKGAIYHSASWPRSAVDWAGKKVAIIGTGASGVQMVQEMSRKASHLTVFQRTPNLCLPMNQRKLSCEDQVADRVNLPRVFERRLTTNSGYLDDFVDRSTLDDSPEQRDAFFDSLWRQGGFKFWIATYRDVLVNEEANRLAYDFWAKKTRSRVSDAQKRDLLAPLEPPHPWGGRRPCLETDYYEQVSKPHVSIIDARRTPIVEFAANGLKTSDGKIHEADIVGFATGFDALTGGMRDMGLLSTTGVSLSEKWSSGVSSYLGLSLEGYPNLFYVFAAHGPTASNGPSCIELQAGWIAEAMVKMRDQSIESIEPTVEAESQWTELLRDIYGKSLIRNTRSWYDGSNIPGKRVEPLVFLGGFPLYRSICYDALRDNFKGFKVRYRQNFQ